MRNKEWGIGEIREVEVMEMTLVVAYEGGRKVRSKGAIMMWVVGKTRGAKVVEITVRK